MRHDPYSIRMKIIKTSKDKNTRGCLVSAEKSPKFFLRASLFSAFPSRSLALYWLLRKTSVAGFHASVSIPFRIPINFLE